MGDLHVIKVQIWMHLEFGYTRKWKSSTREQIENLHKQTEIFYALKRILKSYCKD